MINLNISQFTKSAQTFVAKRSPEILTGMGIAGMITTTILAVKATPKALSLMEKHSVEKAGERHTLLDIEDIPKNLPIQDIFLLTWKCYIPAAVTGGLSIACLVGASSVNARRNAALATAYSLSEAALKEYKTKVIETIGEKKEQNIRDSIAKDKIESVPVSKCEVFITEKGNTLCFDVISGRYFKSDMDKLKKVEYQLNRRLRDEMYISVNDFYGEIGLAYTSVGDNLGWNIDRDYIEFRFSTQLAEDGTPCLVVDYSVAPKYDYR